MQILILQYRYYTTLYLIVTTTISHHILTLNIHILYYNWIRHCTFRHILINHPQHQKNRITTHHTLNFSKIKHITDNIKYRCMFFDIQICQKTCIYIRQYCYVLQYIQKWVISADFATYRQTL